MNNMRRGEEKSLCVWRVGSIFYWMGRGSERTIEEKRMNTKGQKGSVFVPRTMRMGECEKRVWEMRKKEGEGRRKEMCERVTILPESILIPDQTEEGNYFQCTWIIVSVELNSRFWIQEQESKGKNRVAEEGSNEKEEATKNSSIVLFAFLHREIFSSKEESEGLNWFFLSRIKSCELQTDQRKIFFNWGVLEESGRGEKNLLFESRRGREEGRSWILGRNSHHSMMIQWMLECSSCCYSCSWSSCGSNCSNCRTTTSDPSTWMRTTKVMMGKVG